MRNKKIMNYFVEVNPTLNFFLSRTGSGTGIYLRKNDPFPYHNEKKLESKYFGYEMEGVGFDIFNLIISEKRQVKEILEILETRYKEKFSAEEVIDYLYDLAKNAVIYLRQKPQKEIFFRYWHHSKSWRDTTAKDCLFELTYRCNHDCIWCYVKGEKIDKQLELSFDEIKDIIYEIVDMGVISITFSGGEPFLREDILEIITYARQSGLSVRFISNGSLITSKIARRLGKLHITVADISLHALDRKIYKKITNVDNCEKVVAGVRYLKENKIKVRIGGVFTDINMGEVEKLYNFAKKENLFYGFTNYLFVGPRKEHYETIKGLALINKDPEQYKYLLKKEVEWDKHMIHCHGKDINSTLCTVNEAIYITPYGYVVPCSNMKPIHGINIRGKSLREVWNSHEIQKYGKVKWKDLGEKCKNCPDVIKACCVVCMAENENVNGDYREVVEERCKAAKIEYDYLKEKGGFSDREILSGKLMYTKKEVKI